MLVVELFANVIAYALESAAALALGMFRLVKDQRGRKLSRQDGTFGGGLTGRWQLRLGCRHFQFGFDGSQVGLNRVVRQAGLAETERLGTTRNAWRNDGVLAERFRG